MSEARNIIKTHKEKSKLNPDWIKSSEQKWYPEYCAETKIWNFYWTALWDAGLIYFSEDEAEELVEELNEKCKEGWE